MGLFFFYIWHSSLYPKNTSCCFENFWNIWLGSNWDLSDCVCNMIVSCFNVRSWIMFSYCSWIQRRSWLTKIENGLKYLCTEYSLVITFGLRNSSLHMLSAFVSMLLFFSWCQLFNHKARVEEGCLLSTAYLLNLESLCLSKILMKNHLLEAKVNSHPPAVVYENP